MLLLELKLAKALLSALLLVSAATVVQAARGACPNADAPCPHIVTVLADDLGWWDTQVNGNDAAPTPHIKNMVDTGMRLDRHYVFRYCSPTRRSFLTGRFPNHISNAQAPTCSNYMPLEFTLLSEKLSRGANYSCHFVGKGHLGWNTDDHLMINRGFESHVGYLGGAEAYSFGGGDKNVTKGHHDFWSDHEPAFDLVPHIDYSANFYSERTGGIIAEHATRKFNQPLWLHYTIQNVHAPYTLPMAWEVNAYPDYRGTKPDDPEEAAQDHILANMLNMLDSAMGNLTTALTTAQMWPDTLIIFTADNGGIGLGNNHPLRGHKHDPYEGGTRATAFISGGFVPASLRGTSSGDVFVHVADWYATMCGLAGVDPTDTVTLAGAKRPIDSVDVPAPQRANAKLRVWPMLTKQSTAQPRRYLPTTESSIIDTVSPEGFKLINLVGSSRYYQTDQTAIDPADPTVKGHLPCLGSSQKQPTGPGVDPILNCVNETGNGPGTSHNISCCAVCSREQPCLFAIKTDPAETTNIAAQHPAVVAQLSALLQAAVPYGNELGDYDSDSRVLTGRGWTAGARGMDPASLARSYTEVCPVSSEQSKACAHWQGFSGPCFLRKPE